MAQMVVNECSLEAVSIYQVTVNQFLCDDNDQTGAPMKENTCRSIVTWEGLPTRLDTELSLMELFSLPEHQTFLLQRSYLLHQSICLLMT